jgi:hypothetical protein
MASLIHTISYFYYGWKKYGFKITTYSHEKILISHFLVAKYLDDKKEKYENNYYDILLKAEKYYGVTVEECFEANLLI